MKIKARIYWATNDRRLIRRIQEKYGLPQHMNVNWETEAVVDGMTLEALRRGEPEYLVIRATEEICG